VKLYPNTVYLEIRLKKNIKRHIANDTIIRLSNELSMINFIVIAHTMYIAQIYFNKVKICLRIVMAKALAHHCNLSLRVPIHIIV